MSVQGLDEKKTQYLNDYLSHYLEKTLGVQQIVSAETDNQILNQFQQEKSLETDLGFFIEGYETYSPEENELLSKIILAMKLNSDQFQIFNLSEKNNIKQNYKFKIQVYFMDHPKNDFETFSARTLLKKPEFKKQTWDYLKKTILQIGS